MWSRAELRHVAAACARQGVLLVADEIWADWVLPEVAPAEGGHGVGPERGERGERGERFVPCSAVAPAEGCALITLGAPTKTWSLAGLHASYLIIPDEALRRRYLQRAEPAFLAYGSAFATTALLAAYTHGGPWLEAAKAHVARNVAYLVRFVREHVPGIAPLVRLLLRAHCYGCYHSYAAITHTLLLLTVPGARGHLPRLARLQWTAGARRPRPEPDPQPKPQHQTPTSTPTPTPTKRTHSA